MTSANTTHDAEVKARADCIGYLLELARKRRRRMAKQVEQERQSEGQPNETQR